MGSLITLGPKTSCKHLGGSAADYATCPRQAPVLRYIYGTDLSVAIRYLDFLSF